MKCNFPRQALCMRSVLFLFNIWSSGRLPPGVHILVNMKPRILLCKATVKDYVIHTIITELFYHFKTIQAEGLNQY